MNPKIEKVRDEIRKAEARQREIVEYLKTLRIREKQLCDEELIKVMRSMAGKNGDVMELLDKFQNESGEDNNVVDKKQDITAEKSMQPASFVSREAKEDKDED